MPDMAWLRYAHWTMDDVLTIMNVMMKNSKKLFWKLLGIAVPFWVVLFTLLGVVINDHASMEAEVKLFLTLFGFLTAAVILTAALIIAAFKFYLQGEVQNLLRESSKQMAHDLRSPLSALTMVAGSLQGLPDERRALIRNSIQRLNDITNELMEKSGLGPQKVMDSPDALELISDVVDVVVSEKRTQFRKHADLEIEFNHDGSFGAFARVARGQLRALLASLIDVAVGALPAYQGRVVLKVRKVPEAVEIWVVDDGDVSRVEALRRRVISEFSSAFQVDVHQEGNLTLVKVVLQEASAPNWFADSLSFEDKSTLVSVDDDLSIHQLWSGRLSQTNLQQKIQHLRFQSAEPFSQYLEKARGEVEKCLFLIDDRLFNQEQAGLELIESLGLESHAVLVTSHHNEPKLQMKALSLGLKILPKTLAGFIPISR